MFLKNLVECLITINAPHFVQYDKTDKNGKPKEDAKILDVKSGKQFKILPAGEPVEIPDDVATRPEVKNQIDRYVKSGELIKVAGGDSNDADTQDAPGDLSGMSREDLESLAAALSIKFDDKTDNITLIKSIREKS